MVWLDWEVFGPGEDQIQKNLHKHIVENTSYTLSFEARCNSPAQLHIHLGDKLGLTINDYQSEPIEYEIARLPDHWTPYQFEFTTSTLPTARNLIFRASLEYTDSLYVKNVVVTRESNAVELPFWEFGAAQEKEQIKRGVISKIKSLVSKIKFIKGILF